MYSVYRHRFGGMDIPLWDTEDFAEALQVALNHAEGGTLTPLDHTRVVAIQRQGKAVAAWSLPGDDPDTKDILFIAKEK